MSHGEVDYELMLEMLNLCHYWGGVSCGLVHLGTQLYLFHQHLQYSATSNITIIIIVIGVNMVRIILTMWADQWVISMECSFVSVLLILNLEKCFISGILVAITCHSLS